MAENIKDPSQARSPRRRKRSKAGETRLTQAMENYLLSIYLVQEQGLRVTNANLVTQLRRVPATEYLGTSLPSVSGMLRRMEREGLIQISETRDIGLTARGKTLAERIIRRHRLAACMIVDLFGSRTPSRKCGGTSAGTRHFRHPGDRHPKQARQSDCRSVRSTHSGNRLHRSGKGGDAR